MRRGFFALELVGIAAASCALRSGGRSSDGEARPCENARDCPASSNECVISTCFDGWCRVVAAAEHSPLAQQKPGDCAMLECDGAGRVASTADDVDAPPDDGLACTTEACEGGKITRGFAGVGEPCDDAGVCNGRGRCGACGPGARACDGAKPKTCTDDGDWKTAAACDARAPLCRAASCLPAARAVASGLRTCLVFDLAVAAAGAGAGAGTNAEIVCFGAVPFAATPADVTQLSGVTALALGPSHLCARTATGAVLCGGSNTDGQLGDKTFAGRAAPKPVPGVASATAVAVGFAHSCAVADAGKVLCWGKNADGELGRGAASGAAVALQAAPNKAARPTSRALPALPAELFVGVGGECALAAGKLACNAPAGTSFPGDPKAKHAPAEAAAKPVLGVRDAKAVAAGEAHTCAIVEAGRVRCWGRGARGQLGDGARKSRATSVEVKNLLGAVALALGRDSSCARLESGGVVCWGANDAGQLGDGSTTDRAEPASVALASPAVALSAGFRHACATSADHSVTCWGDRAAFASRPGAATKPEAITLE